MAILGCVGVGLLLMAIAGGVSVTAPLVVLILLVYGLWKIGNFIARTIFPFGYPRQDLQPSAPGPHPPLQPAGHNYLFRLDRYEPAQVPK
jgi:Na+-transporting methylmalonyl-CoA/oxaloacetate decarboxylase gamma subunit